MTQHTFTVEIDPKSSVTEATFQRFDDRKEIPVTVKPLESQYKLTPGGTPHTFTLEPGLTQGTAGVMAYYTGVKDGKPIYYYVTFQVETMGQDNVKVQWSEDSKDQLPRGDWQKKTTKAVLS
ncbi:hypothetical protein [Streptomyces sp. 900105245]